MIGNLTTAALFQAEYHQVVRITIPRDSDFVIYAILSDSTEHEVTQVLLSDNTVANVQDIALDNDPYNFDESHILQGGLTIDSYSITGERIEIGTAIASELVMKLKNSDGMFDPMVFAGREMFVEIGTKDWSTDDAITYLPIGYFTVDNEPKDGEEIEVKALDRMVSKFDVEIDWTQFTFPTTVQNLVNTICTVCGVTCVTDLTTLPNYSYSITMSPEGSCSMYRDLIQWAAFLTATCAQFDENGNLRFKWYTATGFSLTAANRFSHDIENTDITLTGLHYKDSNSLEYLSGTADYTLENVGCGILQNNVETALDSTLAAVTGFTYRPFEATIVTAPFLQPLDIVSFTDARGDVHNCIISHVNYLLNGNTMVAGKGDTEVTTNYAQQTGLTLQQSLAVDDAKRQAINYLSVDSTGIMIANMTDGTRYTPREIPDGIKNTFIDEDSFEVRDGTTVLATFGETSQIGQDDANHLSIDTAGIQGVNSDGMSVFDINMDGGIIPFSGTYTNWYSGIYDFLSESTPVWSESFHNSPSVSPYFTACTTYTATYELILTYSDDSTSSESVSATFTQDGTAIGYDNRKSVTVTKSYGTLVMSYWVQSSSGHVVNSISGTFVLDTSTSPYVVDVKVHGPILEYSGYTPAPSYSLGIRVDDTAGAYSTVCGEGLSAETRGQFACGRYNADSSDYAMMVGNGNESGESNALAVTWDGDLLCDIDTEAVSGDDHTLYSLITAYGWEEEVIVDA